MKGNDNFEGPELQFEGKTDCFQKPPGSPNKQTDSSHKLYNNLISELEFSCHCCYDILINPTTLNCGHSFCRHCLALWWDSSKKTECPECREKWEGFPKVNILLRNAVEKLFPKVVSQRKAEIQLDHKISQSLEAFQKYGDEQLARGVNSFVGQRRQGGAGGGGGFFSGVLTALTCVAVILLVYHWSNREEQDLLVHKPIEKWTAEEVLFWLEQLGPWASLYKETFLEHKVNGSRLLMMMEDNDLFIENPTHKKAVLRELDHVKKLGAKPPQNLWEYKAVNAGKSLFLLYALKSTPRLTMLYLYLFDYTESFLPFMHTSCPGNAEEFEDGFLKKHLLRDPGWNQWAQFLVKYTFLPYQLIAAFAWNWLTVHYWTSRFIIVNAMLLSLLEAFAFWRLWSRGELRTLHQRMFSHFWKVTSQGLLVVIVWPITPQFVCNCLFYWALYFNPIINIDLVVKEIRSLDTQVP
ncbi:bifunctional apoptosis regulator-like isoform X1 [Erpetoichthys calabaricus]|uniref:Bifunctional apoptosis regulator n=1 Tax=Erpetoichthys calabaricus TaxID=27687 RepID=A0A8C4SGQ3_ERPCA|nr:bifunctional apoptosis regulator-like isoform X1 [Erpetoichthys calabaricus]XP_028669703.1 bifunctional apoptosis regulator-like isoform X1 [Erpetoichthys calabaricus]